MSDTKNDPQRPAAQAGQLTDPLLWKRIKSAKLPVSRARHEFAEALARRIDLPIFEAREVVEEYRRFLYLATITDELRVPPLPLRRAWALHAHVPEYAAFCDDVLQTQLGFDDGARRFGAATAYRRTIEAYEREFGAKPPVAVWPPAIKVRIPRWLTAHAAVLGFTGVIALDRGEPFIFAAGVGVSLAIYGFDLYGTNMARKRRGIDAEMSDDLAYFLSETDTP